MLHYCSSHIIKYRGIFATMIKSIKLHGLCAHDPTQ